MFSADYTYMFIYLEKGGKIVTIDCSITIVSEKKLI
jgi:hypothetical protein